MRALQIATPRGMREAEGNLSNRAGDPPGCLSPRRPALKVLFLKLTFEQRIRAFQFWGLPGRSI